MNETRQEIVDLCFILRSSRRDLQRAVNANQLVETRLKDLERKLADSGADRESKGDQSREHDQPSRKPPERKCRICGRELVDYDATDADDPAMDCGGDCWGCIREIEEESWKRWGWDQWRAHRPADPPPRGSDRESKEDQSREQCSECEFWQTHFDDEVRYSNKLARELHKARERKIEITDEMVERAALAMIKAGARVVEDAHLRPALRAALAEVEGE